MTNPRRIALALVVVALGFAPVTASAQQSFNLRDLLTDFVREGITLAEPPEGSPFPSHAHHFIGDESIVPLEQLNNQLAAQISTFPLASSAGGFTYDYDPALGTFTRASPSFGPIFAERAVTNGLHKFNFGINYSHFDFERIDSLSLRDGDVRIVYRHQDLPPSPCCLNPFFEGDVIETQMLLKIKSDVTAFNFSYGVTDRLDLGAAIPIVRVDIQAQTVATINRLATGGSPATAGIHKFPDGSDSSTFSQAGSASGIGDAVVRGKFRLTSGRSFGAAVAVEARLPTGEEKDLLGTGVTQVRGFLVGVGQFGSFSPHINAGYTYSSDKSVIPEQINATGGFDWALDPRLTFALDVITRTDLNTLVLKEQPTPFVYNTAPGGPPDIHTATLTQLVATREDSTIWTGSAGFRVSPVGNLLITINGLFSLNKRGLQTKFSPLVAIDYNF